MAQSRGAPATPVKGSTQPGMNPQVPTIPAVSVDVATIVNAIQRMRQGIESLGGLTGDPINRAVTFADLLRMNVLDWYAGMLVPTGANSSGVSSGASGGALGGVLGTIAVPPIHVSTAAPVANSSIALWYDPTAPGRIFIPISGAWVELPLHGG